MRPKRGLHRLVFGLVVFLGLLAPGVCTADGNAKAVLDAVRDDDDARLKALSEDPTIDVWWLAYRVARTDKAAAVRFARASESPSAPQLVAWLAARGSRKPSKALTQAMDKTDASPEGPSAALQKAMRAVLSEADDFEKARLHLALARPLGWPAGEQDFDVAIAAAKKVGWSPGVALGLHAAGMAAAMAGDLQAARAQWEQQLAAESLRGSRQEMAQVLNNLAGLDHMQGDYAGALSRLRVLTAQLKARPQAEFSIAEVYSNIAFIHERRGEYNSSLRAALLASNSVSKERDPRLWAEAELAVAASRIWAGQHERAIRNIEGAQAALVGDVTPEGKATAAQCRGMKGRALLKLGAFEEALAELEVARAYYESAGDAEHRVNVLSHIALVHQKQGKHDVAIELATQALDRLSGRPDEWRIADVRQILARSHVRLGQLDRAWAFNEKSIEEATEHWLLRDGYLRRAEILMARKDHAGVEKACGLAYGELAAMVLGLPEGTNATARATHAEIYELALQAAVWRKDPAAFFTWIERARAGALLESITDRARIQNAVIPEQLRVREERARDLEAKAAGDYREARGDPTVKRRARKQLRKDLVAARAQLSDIRAEIQLAQKAASDLLFPKADTLKEVQARQPKDNALVSFAMTGDRVFAVVVRQDNARIVDLGARKPIEAAAEATLKGLQERDGDTAPVSSLRNLLGAPLKLDKAVTALTIVPDGVLYSVPFAAVFEARTVTYAHSATTLGVLHPESEKRGKGVLALGAPVYTGRSLPPLPGTREEVKTIAKGQTILLDEQAGEVSLRTELGRRERWRAVHLACHGVIDTEYPLQSSLELSVQPNSDGHLMAAEVFDMRFVCDLAVLSACQTGRGTILKSEGLLGLTRAFMIAGAPRVLCSLWKVDDQATLALMTKFYEYWNPPNGKGLSASEALRKAQQHVQTVKDSRASAGGPIPTFGRLGHSGASSSSDATDWARSRHRHWPRVEELRHGLDGGTPLPIRRAVESVLAGVKAEGQEPKTDSQRQRGKEEDGKAKAGRKVVMGRGTGGCDQLPRMARRRRRRWPMFCWRRAVRAPTSSTAERTTGSVMLLACRAAILPSHESRVRQ